MTLTLFIIKDADGAPVAGPFVCEDDANRRARVIAAKEPLKVEPHTFDTVAGEGTLWRG